MANEIIGAKSYLHLLSESTWGVNPDDSSGSGGSTDFLQCPVDEYSVRFRPEVRQANPFIGIYQRKHSKNFRGLPSGTLRTALYGAAPPGGSTSLAEYLMDWGFESQESDALPSKTAIWAEGPDVANSEHNGLRVGAATLSGSDDTGFCELSLDLMGQTEDAQGGAPAVPTNRDQLQEMEFKDATFKLAGSTIALKSFSLALTRGLTPHYLNSFTPTHLFPGDYSMTLQMVIAKNSTTYDIIRRQSTLDTRTGEIVLLGLHNSTLTNSSTKVTISFDRLVTVDADDDRARDNLNFQTLNFFVTKPDTANNGFRTAWTTV